VAIAILKEIGFKDAEHPIIQGIIRFLGSGASFVQKGWLQKLPSNNDYPHAHGGLAAMARPGGFMRVSSTAQQLRWLSFACASCRPSQSCGKPPGELPAKR
jgi:hypothetical protein